MREKGRGEATDETQWARNERRPRIDSRAATNERRFGSCLSPPSPTLKTHPPLAKNTHRQRREATNCCIMNRYALDGNVSESISFGIARMVMVIGIGFGPMIVGQFQCNTVVRPQKIMCFLCARCQRVFGSIEGQRSEKVQGELILRKIKRINDSETQILIKWHRHGWIFDP